MKNNSTFNLKKSLFPLLIHSVLFILLFIIIFLNSYLYFQEINKTFNLISLILFSGIELINVILFILYLSTSSLIVDILKSDKNLIVSKPFHKIIINYDDIFTVYSSSFSYSFFSNGYSLIYLNNGKIIKVKYLKYPQELERYIRTKLKEESKNYLIDKENKLGKFFTRIFNFFETIYSSTIKIHKAKVFTELNDFPIILKENKNKKPLIVSYSNELDRFKNLFSILKENNIDYFFYHYSKRNPSISDVYELKEIYLKNNCDSIIAIGGGSVIDLSKALGITITNKKDLSHYAGLFKVKKNIPTLIACPTLIASASETTSSSVITFLDAKKAITSFKITPKYAYLGEEYLKYLDNDLLKKSILDAFVHAIESYLNAFKNKRFDKLSLNSMKVIIDNLLELITSQNENNDKKIIKIKLNLAKASFDAGIAFSYKGVGNIHALSHPLSYKYNLPHAITNATIMPYVLKTYIFNKSGLNKLSKIYDYLDLSKNNSLSKIEKANNLILYLESINKKVGINNKIKEINPDDIKELAQMAKKESTPKYGTPYHYSLLEFMKMYINIKN